jgi:mannose/cellobiose epimerase-like protein (N-acyl-D-glucosamine 2-epimerase family)
MTAASGTAAKPITRALIAALEATVPGTERSNLHRIVDSLIDKAIGGDLAAMREIFDRIDGKASAAGAGAGAAEPPMVRFEWKRDE